MNNTIKIFVVSIGVYYWFLVKTITPQLSLVRVTEGVSGFGFILKDRLSM